MLISEIIAFEQKNNNDIFAVHVQIKWIEFSWWLSLIRSLWNCIICTNYEKMLFNIMQNINIQNEIGVKDSLL